MPCPYEMLMFSPGASGQENQNGENLQSACQHCQRQHNFGYATIDAEIAHRANSFHTGTDVVKTGQNSRNVGANRKTVQRNHQIANDDDNHIGCQIGVGVFQNFFIHCTTVITHNHNLPGVENLPDISTQNFENQQHTGHFDTTACGTGTGADDHQCQEDALGEGGPLVKVRCGVAGGGHKGADLEGGVTNGVPQIAVNAPESFISLSPIIKQHPQYQELPKV